jgi:AraC-like DNA-binding protein
LDGYENLPIARLEGDELKIIGVSNTPIRVYHVLAHISGIEMGDIITAITAKLHESEKQSLKEVVEYFSDKPLFFETGTAQSYGPHVALDIAARIVEIVSGMDYASYVKQNITDVIGMKDTTFTPTNEQWSRLVKKHKLDVRVYRGDADGSIGGFIDRLPKPAAVFAASDKIAFSVVSALRNPGAVIPGRVVLLGVDNDELMCNSVTPRLSSVNPDHYEEGAVAQRELALLMRARNPRPVKTILCGKMDLVSRESTVHLAPAAKILSRALDYILRHAVEGITPDMVAAHIGVSRRLLDLRFRELHPRTVAQSILDVKLEAVKRLLAETEMPIGDIAGKCGFANSNHLKNVFCSRFGVSMRTFRQSAAGVSG